MVNSRDPVRTIGVRTRLFLKVAGFAASLPRFRGRTRASLALFDALGLAREHVIVTARLEEPTHFTARLDLHSWLQRIAYLTGGYEADTVRFLSKLHATRQHDGCDGYVLDIGANVGLIAIPLALTTTGADPRVIAVEAVPDNAEALRANIILNGLTSRIAVISTAIGHERRSVEIQVEGDLSRGEGTGTANVLAEGSPYRCVRQEIQLETIDDLRRAGTIPPRCAVMKLDTDGYDLNVLRGAYAFLESERPVIFGEFETHCLSWHGQSVSDVIELATTHDYRTWQRARRGWVFSEDVEPSTFRQDLLLVPTELVPRFQWCLRG